MAKVARAARNASLMRVETITADKTLTSAETGEVYFINYNTAAALTITLPAMKAGAYFKFIWIADFTADGTVVFNSATNTAGDFGGSVFEQVTGGSNANSAVQLCGSHDILTISDDIDIGSYLEVFCDGSTWYWTGHLSVSAVGLSVFSS